MIHTLEVSCRSLTYPELYRDTVFTFIVYPEMYRDTVFTIVILICITILYRSWCLPVFLRSVFLLLHARFLGFVWSFQHTCLSRCFIVRFTVESVQCRNESIGRHPMSRVVQRTLGKYGALSVGVEQVGTWLFSLLSTRLETWNSRGMHMDLSRGMKVNEFADLTTK